MCMKSIWTQGTQQECTQACDKADWVYTPVFTYRYKNIHCSNKKYMHIREYLDKKTALPYNSKQNKNSLFVYASCNPSAK